MLALRLSAQNPQCASMMCLDLSDLQEKALAPVSLNPSSSWGLFRGNIGFYSDSGKENGNCHMAYSDGNYHIVCWGYMGITENGNYSNGLLGTSIMNAEAGVCRGSASP